MPLSYPLKVSNPEGPTRAQWLIDLILYIIGEWAEMLAMAALMCLAAFICLWCFCRIREQIAHKAVVYQALIVVDSNEVVSIWLASLKN